MWHIKSSRSLVGGNGVGYSAKRFLALGTDQNNEEPLADAVPPKLTELNKLGVYEVIVLD